MKTKFILHGGFNAEKTDEDNSEFYKEILKDAPERAHVLLVPFAKDEDRIPLATQKVASEFNNNQWQKSIIVEVANKNDFLTQLQVANVVYFHGGVSARLLDALKNYPELGELLKGKIVAGESAGANVLGAFFYSRQANEVFEGLGILPLKIIPHYKKEDEGKLDNVGVGLETVLLPEYQFKVFEI